MTNKLINSAESIRQKLKNLAEKRNRPFDEILRYFAMERFLYRLSISKYNDRFFLKGGLMLKVWNADETRATMDIDLLARTSNKIENLRRIISEISVLPTPDDAISFQTQKLILRETQTGGDYQGVSASLFAKLFTTKIPILIDIGFNDIIIPEPQKIRYPTLLTMPAPILLGYTLETIVAEKLETVAKRGVLNTRMKDFYDLWILCQKNALKPETLKQAIEEVFAKRGTQFEPLVAFTEAFYETSETKQRWQTFLSAMGKKDLPLPLVMREISSFLMPFLRNH